MRAAAPAIALLLLLLLLPAYPVVAGCEAVPCHDYATPSPLKAWLEIDPSGRLDYGVINPQLEIVGNVGWMLTDYGPSLVSYDVSDPLHISRIRMKLLPLAVSRIVVADGHAYAGGEGYVICDVTSPTDARVLYQSSDPGATYRPICQRGGYLYMAYSRSYESGLRVIDVRNPAQPQLVTTLGCPQSPVAKASGNLLAHASQYNLTLIDIADPAHPVEIVTLLQGAAALAFDGDLVYAGNPGGTRVYDISQPATPTVVTTIPARDPLLMLAAGNRLYVADRYEGLVTWDVSDPASVAPVSTIGGLFGLVDLERCGPYLLTTSRGAILHTVDPEIAPSPAPLLAESVLPLAFTAGLAMADDTVYAISHVNSINQPYELRILDVSEPSSVRVLGQLTTPVSLANPRLQGSHLICNRMIVIDVGDPSAPRLVAGPYAGSTVVLRDSLAFAAGGGPGGTELHVYNVRDPAHPAHLGSRNLGFNASPMIGAGDVLVAADQTLIRTLDASDPLNVVPLGSLMNPAGFCGALAVRDNLVFAAGNNGELAIIDISTPATPRVRSFFETPDRSQPGSLANGVVYLNNNAFGALVIDVADPDRPSFLGVVPTAVPLLNGTSQTSVPTTLALADGYLLSVKASQGLRFAARQCGDVQPLVIAALDVAPADPCHRVRCGAAAKGLITVAIVTSGDFAASDLDPATVRFGPGAAAEFRGGADELVRLTDDGGAVVEPPEPGGDSASRRLHDYDGDGDLDLVLRFAAHEVAFACGDSIGAFTGATYDGVAVCGEGPVTTAADCPGVRDTVPAVDLVEGAKALGAGSGESAFSAAPALSPNPLNPLTQLSFTLAEPTRLRISVHDLAGRRLSVLADDGFAAGVHTLPWRGQDESGRPLPSGVYFVRITGDDADVTLRAVLVR
jgi:hypothetical protein